jgi:hypothetical protein
VKQLLDGDPARHYPGIRSLSSPPLHLSVPVTVEDFAMKAMRDDLRADIAQSLDEMKSVVADSTRAADAAVAAVATVARIAEQVSKPRRVRKIPQRDESGRIVAVIEEEE